MLNVSVDDRRALWALTERCLRSDAHRAVLVVRDALRRGARHIRIRSTRAALIVDDDGVPIDDTIADVASVLRAPTVSALHRLENERGTDLLVALATAISGRVVGEAKFLDVGAGGLAQLDADAAVVREVRRGLAPFGKHPAQNRVLLRRTAEAARAEGAELRSWLAAPRAIVTLNGRRLDGSLRGPLPGQLQLGQRALWPSHFRSTGGHGVVGIAVDERQSRLTTLTQGIWVAQELVRADGLAIVGVWDDDDIPARGADAVARARAALGRAARRLMVRLADDFVELPSRQRRRLRSLLVADAVPSALSALPLFDTEAGPFSISLDELRRRGRVVVGDDYGDVIAGDDVRAFLHRQRDLTVVDALPPPRPRWSFRLGLPVRPSIT